MNCEQFKAEIYEFQSDELSSDERDAMQEHLEQCPACRRRLDFEDRMLRELDETSSKRAPAGT